MKLEKQLVALELAMKMDKLGFKQKSLFNWIKTTEGWKLPKSFSDYSECKNKYSAYTVAELGEMLSKYGNYITWMTNDNKWAITKMNEIEFQELDSNTEANVKAKMLIYLIENKLIKL